MRTKRNAFMAAPKKFKGPVMSGSLYAPGFHTASDRETVYPYAQGKLDYVPMHYYELHEGRKLDDYPVIVTLDMQGLRPQPDYDAGVIKESVVDVLKELGSSIRHESAYDQLVNMTDFSEEELDENVKDDPMFSLFYFSGIGEENTARRLRLYAEKQPDPEKFMKRLVRIGVPDNETVMRMIGQFRYTQDVSDDRIIGVEYMKPCWGSVFPHPDDPQFKQNQADAIEAAGYTLITLAEIYEFRNPVVTTPVWAKEIRKNARIEFHGTSYRNLLSAAPFLATLLPEPPQPYERPEYENPHQRMSVSALVAHHDSVAEAFSHCLHGDWSRSRGPILVTPVMGTDKFQVIDGYHRLVKYMILGRNTLPVVVDTGPLKYHFAIARASEQFKFDPDARFIGLESIADPELLQELSEKFARSPE